MRFTVNEYSKHFKMSKEMVYAKLRQKRLNYIMEEGVTYIIVPQHPDEEHPQERPSKEESTPSATPPPLKPKTTVGTIIALYQRENHHLKQRIKELEAKIDKLIDDKEQMLIGERDRIEQIYSTKDEQLKTILNLVNTKLMLCEDHTVHDVDVSEKGHEEDIIEHQGFVELKKYLKTLELSSRQRKSIKKRFAAAYGNDSRVLQQNGAFYLDFDRFDYSDLLDTNL